MNDHSKNEYILKTLSERIQYASLLQDLLFREYLGKNTPDNASLLSNYYTIQALAAAIHDQLESASDLADILLH